MKRTLLFIACALASFSMLAQGEVKAMPNTSVVTMAQENNYKPLVDGRTVWKYTMPTLGSAPITLTVSLEGPVEFDGKTCYEMVILDDNNTNQTKGTYIYEDSGCVYVYNYWDYKPYEWAKRFDFNLKEGENNVQSIETVTVCGVSYRCLNFGGDYWVEGIGDSRLGILPVSFFTTMPTSGNSNSPSVHLSVYRDNQLIFTNEEFQTAIANTLPETRKPVYNTFVVDGKKWNCVRYTSNQPEPLSFYLKGDTLIGGQECTKMYRDGIYTAAFYEEKGRVYEYRKGNETPSLLYDDYQNVGDKGMFLGNKLEVIRIDTLESHNHSFRVIYLFDGNNYDYTGITTIVSGIGGDIDNLFGSAGLVGGRTPAVISCEQDGQEIFSRADIFTQTYRKGIIEWLSNWMMERYMADQQQQPKTDEEEHPRMLVDGRTWNMMKVQIDYTTPEYKSDTTYYSYTFEVETDTIVDGIPCYKTKDGKFLYEKDGQVCHYWDSDKKWHQLFDFSLQPGEVFGNVSDIEHLTVSAIDTILVNDRSYRRFKFKLGEFEFNYDNCWVEGIGSSVDGLFNQIVHVTVMSKPVYTYCLSVYDGDKCIFTKDDFYAKAATNSAANIPYRPFVEDGKVWKVGRVGSNPVQLVEYYYFDGDTIIDGKTCKQMMRQRYISPDYPDYDIMMQYSLLSYVGAWYEEDKKVYVYDDANKAFRMMYDFSLDDNGTFVIDGNDPPYVLGPKQTGGIKGFKGVYRDVMRGEPAGYNTTWLEGVGGIEGPIYNVYYGKEYHGAFLMSCTVGDEVIYFNDEYEDGATPDAARKQRIDFTHTIKTKPKTRMRDGSERRRIGDADASGMQSLYGEYNNVKLGINLDPLDDAYLVRITDETGKTVYEKDINAGSIVGLNIDISAYAKGRYTVTVENGDESFTGEFDTQTTGVSDALRLNDHGKKINDNIYNLQGQRLRSLQKGLNIVNGRKVIVR